MTLILDSDRNSAATYSFAVPGAPHVVGSWPALTKELLDRPEVTLVVIGADMPLDAALAFAEQQRLARPGLGVVLLRRRIDVSVLSASLRAGVREVVAPDDTAALADACRRSLEVSERASQSRGRDAATSEGKIVTVFAAKGGCGKTTVATNLAVTIAAGGRTVCLVDLDLAFGDVGIALQLFPTRSIVDAVAMQHTLDEAGVRSLLTTHSSGVETLLAPLEPKDAERIPTAVVTEVLTVLRRMFDVVVIDTPPDFKDWVLAALDLSDAHVLLATLDIPALKNLRLTLDMLDVLGYPRERWHVVLNRSDSKVGLDVHDVEKTISVPLAAQLPSSRAVSESINRGVPLAASQPNHPVSRALRELVEQRLFPAAPADEAHGAAPANREATARRRGFPMLRKAVAR